MDVVMERHDLLVFSENGYAKRAALTQYPTQGRAGKGVVTAKPGATSGMLVGAAIVQADTQLAVVTNKGKAKLIRAKIAPSRNRDGRIDEVFALAQGDSVAMLVVPAGRAQVDAPLEPEAEMDTAQEAEAEVEPEAEAEEESAQENTNKSQGAGRKSQAVNGKDNGKVKAMGKGKAVQLAFEEE
jgi:hypothetical protein